MSIPDLVLSSLRAQIPKLRKPSKTDKIYKDECIYSYDSPFSDGGLYLNMITFHGVGKDYLLLDMKKTNSKLYLHIKYNQILKKTNDEKDGGLNMNIDSKEESWEILDKAECKDEKNLPDGENNKSDLKSSFKDESKTASNNSNVSKEVTKLAIGVSGGFISESKYDIEKEFNLVVVTNTIEDSNQVDNLVIIPYPLPENSSNNIPEFILSIVQIVIESNGMKENMDVNTWDADNEKIVSKYAIDLIQLNPEGKKISQDPNSWRDEESGSTENLWLNLSTGYIGGGRKNWDGSGGSGSALKHYQYHLDTHGNRYPLVVKLGTITPHSADVWSYSDDEDCLVIDPLLPEHLSFWGIDIMKLEKTEKTLTEMEVSLNQSYDWSRILDGQEDLQLLKGPGLVGLRNIGSSCYMNSLLQTIIAIPEVQERYFKRHQNIISTIPAGYEPVDDFPVQFSKLSTALLTDRYISPSPVNTTITTAKVSLEEEVSDESVLEKYVVAPRMFKHLVGKGNPEFSSGRQQDVSEYFMHFLEVMNRSERTSLHRLSFSASPRPTPTLFEFHLETRLQCSVTNQVKYSSVGQQSLFNIMELRIPTDKAVSVTNNSNVNDDKQESKRMKTENNNNNGDDVLVPFESCLETFFNSETVDLFNPSVEHIVPFVKTTKFKCFPRYLMIKLGRYYVGPNWVQMKINARVNFSEQLDLSQYRGTGLQADEVLVPEATTTTTATETKEEIVVNEEIVMQLMSMGFSENGCRRAAIAVNNSDAETAMNWIFEHMEDANFNDPVEISKPTTTTGTNEGGAKTAITIDPEVMMMLTSMGYTEQQTTAALIATDNNIERAADWLFSHADTIDQSVAEVLNLQSPTTNSSVGVVDNKVEMIDDGEGKYELLSIISHIGKNTDHGHYVCHVKKENQWVLFNDEKVGKCKNPPLEYGFMYLYRRKDGSGSLEN